jgi:hypothetical protein
MINPGDDWDMLLEEVETEDDYADDWYCQSCELGPIAEDKDKCPRCGCKWNEQCPPGDEMDEDGWGEEKEYVEEIW